MKSLERRLINLEKSFDPEVSIMVISGYGLVSKSKSPRLDGIREDEGFVDSNGIGTIVMLNRVDACGRIGPFIRNLTSLETSAFLEHQIIPKK